MDFTAAISDLLNALNDAPLVCLIPEVPEVIYGPFTPDEAMEFCAKWNEWNRAHAMPGTWTARPLLSGKP